MRVRAKFWNLGGGVSSKNWRNYIYFYQAVPEEVIHVHALGPALLVADLLLVLQVANDPEKAEFVFLFFFVGM